MHEQPEVREAVEVAQRAVHDRFELHARLHVRRGDGLERHAVERAIRAAHHADRGVCDRGHRVAPLEREDVDLGAGGELAGAVRGDHEAVALAERAGHVRALALGRGRLEHAVGAAHERAR